MAEPARSNEAWEITEAWLASEHKDLLKKLPEGFIPPGVLDPAYVPPNQSSTILYTCILTYTFAFLFVMGRIFSRRTILGSARWTMDDIALLISLTSVGVFTVVQCIGSTEGGWGRHLYDLYPDEVVKGYSLIFAHQITYPLAIYFTKVSILLFLWRSRPTELLKKLIIAMMVYMTAFTIIVELVMTFQCRPVASAWNLPLRIQTTPLGKLSPELGATAVTTGDCVDMAAMWYSLAGIHVLGDFLLVLMPMEIVWRLRNTISLTSRLKVAALFGLGGVAFAAAVARMIYLIKATWNFDFTWGVRGTVISAQLECTLAIICVCIPSLRPMARNAASQVWSSVITSNVARRLNNPLSYRQSKNQGSTREYTLRSADGTVRTTWGDGGDMENGDLKSQTRRVVTQPEGEHVNFELRQDPLKGDVEMGIKMELCSIASEGDVEDYTIHRESGFNAEELELEPFPMPLTPGSRRPSTTVLTPTTVTPPPVVLGASCYTSITESLPLKIQLANLDEHLSPSEKPSTPRCSRISLPSFQTTSVHDDRHRRRISRCSVPPGHVMEQSQSQHTRENSIASNESESKWVYDEISDYWEFLDHSLSTNPSGDQSRPDLPLSFAPTVHHGHSSAPNTVPKTSLGSLEVEVLSIDRSGPRPRRMTFGEFDIDDPDADRLFFGMDGKQIAYTSMSEVALEKNAG